MAILNKKHYTLGILYWFAIFVGVLLRIQQYLANRSLWRDEARIALNIIERSYSNFFTPLSYDQKAPPGFLIIEKFLTQTFGTSEYAFRILPLLCSIISIFLFYILTKKLCSSFTACLANWLFAISFPIIYYSSEVKQYSCDVMIALLLLVTAVYLTNNSSTFSKALFMGIIGALSIWISHTAIIILISAGWFLLLFLNSKSRIKKLMSLVVAYIPWLLSFYLLYLISIRSIETDYLFYVFWDKHFMPLPLFSQKNILWFYKEWSDLFYFLKLDFFIIFIFLLGLFFVFVNNKRGFYIFVPQILVTLLASAFHKYAFCDRLLLFLIPSIIYLISEGIGFIQTKTRAFVPIIIIVIICTFSKPLFYTQYCLKYSLPSKEEIKPVLSYLQQHIKPGDVIYLNNHLQFAFKYYAKKYNFDENFEMITEENKDIVKNGLFYKKENYSLFIDPVIEKKENCNYLFDKVIGNKRVWVLYSTYVDYLICNFPDYLDKIGVKLDSFKRNGVNLYLYDLRRE